MSLVILGNTQLVTGDGGFGFSITSPFKAVAHATTSAVKTVGKRAAAVGKGAARGTVAAGRGVAHGAVAVGHGTEQLARKYGKEAALLAVLPVAVVTKDIVAPALKATVLRPVISRINTLKDRRAKKIAWDRRQSTTPTPQERSEASSWTKSHLRSQTPPFGLMMSVLAGAAPQTSLRGLGEPTTATIAAAVPALVALLNAILSKANSSGDAPAHVGGGKAGSVPVAPGGDAADGGQLAPGDDTGADPNGSGGTSLPFGLTKKQLTIGGVVLGGAVVLALLTRK